MLCIGLTTVSIHLESHDASPGLSEHPGQFPGTPSCLQSCKPTLHLRGKKMGGGKEGRERKGEDRTEEEETVREEKRGRKEGRTGGRSIHTHNVVNYLKCSYHS